MSQQVKKVGLLLMIALTSATFWIHSKISPPVSAAPMASQPTSICGTAFPRFVCADRLESLSHSPKIGRPLKLKSASTPIALLVSVEAPASLGSNTAARPLPLVGPVATPALKTTPFFLIHPVRAGETLISIAARYNLSTEKLLAANEIRDPTRLAQGTELLIPRGEGLYQGKIIPHRIKAGETLLSLAVKYGSSVKAIAVANPHQELDPLRPGETLAVPVIFSEANSVTRVEAPAEASYHFVQSGETPLAIAAAYDLPVEILLAANHILDPTRLQIGQRLMIPAHEGLNRDFPVILYELAAGDMLVGLASRFGSSVKNILAVNPGLDPASLTVGQQVAIPVIFAPARPASPAAPPPTAGSPPATLLDLQQQVIAAVNVERQKHGLVAYLLDEQLDSIALAHAQDMVMRDFLAHVTPDGKTLPDRLAEGGVEGVNRSGENIQRNARPHPQAAEAAVAWFMNSPPHRYNLLNEQYNQMGVSVVEGAPGWYTFVLVFVQR